jgi:hypothetical protein
MPVRIVTYHNSNEFKINRKALNWPASGGCLGSSPTDGEMVADAEIAIENNMIPWLPFRFRAGAHGTPTARVVFARRSSS